MRSTLSDGFEYDLRTTELRADRPWGENGTLASSVRVTSRGAERRLQPQRGSGGDAHALNLRYGISAAVDPPSGMKAHQAEFLLDLIEAESVLPQSQFAETQMSKETLTMKEPKPGGNAYRGKQKPQAGEPLSGGLSHFRGRFLMGFLMGVLGLFWLDLLGKGRPDSVPSPLPVPASPRRTAESVAPRRRLADQQQLEAAACPEPADESSVNDYAYRA